MYFRNDLGSWGVDDLVLREISYGRRAARALGRLIAGLCVIAFGATACATSSRLERSQVVARDGQPMIIDIMPRYWQFRDATKGADSPTTVRLFHDIVVDGDSVVYKDFTGGPSDATIASFLAKVGPYEPAMRIVHERIRSELPRYIRRFSDVLPDARWDSITFYIMPWLFISNGGGGPSSSGGQVMIFGVDAVLRDQGANGDLAPLFYHELFHLYHSRIQSLTFPDLERLPRSRTPLWQLLWREGLATYAASRLTPSSSMDAIVGDSLAERVKPHLAEFSRDLRSQLDSTSAPTFRLYFTGMVRGPELPPARSGYYIGMLVAERLGQTRSLPELARLGGPQLRSLIEEELRKLE